MMMMVTGDGLSPRLLLRMRRCCRCVLMMVIIGDDVFIDAPTLQRAPE